MGNEDICCFFSIVNLRLASSHEDRIADSFAAFAFQLNNASLSGFLRSVSEGEDKLKTIRRANVPTEAIYSYLCNKVVSSEWEGLSK